MLNWEENYTEVNSDILHHHPLYGTLFGWFSILLQVNDSCKQLLMGDQSAAGPPVIVVNEVAVGNGSISRAH